MVFESAEAILKGVVGTKRVFDLVDQNAKQRPTAPALIEHETDEVVSWADLSLRSAAFAAQLQAYGLRYGDVLMTQLPSIKEHVYVYVACCRLGVVFCPVDLRIRGEELRKSFCAVRPKAFFFLGHTEVFDFRPQVTALLSDPQIRQFCSLWVQFQKEPELVISHPDIHVYSAVEFASTIKLQYAYRSITLQLWWASWYVTGDEPAIIIFTTGSTGAPKPAIVTQQGVISQASSLVRHVGTRILSPEWEPRFLNNLPLSHIGGIGEVFTTCLILKVTQVLLSVFKADKSLEAIQKHHVSAVTQIPAMYSLMWRLPNYSSWDISSLKLAAFGGQSVTSDFLSKLSKMAPWVFTGLGLTEASGFCTFIALPSDQCTVLTNRLGVADDSYPMTIRAPKNPDTGMAGYVLPEGQAGEICFQGPQTFKGYFGLLKETAETVTGDGILYTGDIGVYTQTNGLEYVCRQRAVVKPKGYMVFPPEIEEHVMSKLAGKVTSCAVVGLPHEVFCEAMMVFVEKAAGQSVEAEQVLASCSDLTAYKRPIHAVVMEPNTLPLNRVAKVDYVTLKKQAADIVTALRSAGKWDK